MKRDFNTAPELLIQ